MGKKGIKVIAYRPVAKTSITEIGNLPDTGAAEYLERLKNSFILKQGYMDEGSRIDVDFNVFGKGFKYQSIFPGGPEVPVAGVVRKVDVTVDGELGLQVRGLDLSVRDAAKLWAKDDPMAAFAALLTGDDTLVGSDYADPLLWGGKGNDLLWGRGGNDVLDGFKGNDINDGGLGNDYLVDVKGKDWFQFSTGLQLSAELNRDYNFDTIRKFGKGDEIYLKTGVFLGIGDTLSKSEFFFGSEATSTKHRILFDGTTGYWDGDGSGSAYEPIPFFEIENGAKNINHKVFVMGVMYGDGY